MYDNCKNGWGKSSENKKRNQDLLTSFSISRDPIWSVIAAFCDIRIWSEGFGTEADSALSNERHFRRLWRSRVANCFTFCLSIILKLLWFVDLILSLAICCFDSFCSFTLFLNWAESAATVGTRWAVCWMGPFCVTDEGVWRRWVVLWSRPRFWLDPCVRTRVHDLLRFGIFLLWVEPAVVVVASRRVGVASPISSASVLLIFGRPQMMLLLVYYD